MQDLRDTRKGSVPWALASALSAIVVLLLPGWASAHAMDMVALDLRVDGQAVEEDLLFSPVSLAALVPLDADGDGALSQTDLDAQLPALFLVTFGQAPLTADGVTCTLSPLHAGPDGGAIRLRARGACPEGWRKLRQKLGFLSSLAEGHRVVVQANLDGTRHDGVADRATQVLAWEREAPRGLSQFVALGVEHIFTGYDHLLFLLGLLLAGGSVRRLLVVVSCFTLAHSVTLALAALSVVTLPSRLVESAIAGSIIFVAAENFLVKEPRRRGLLAFSFGLVHGFGFASVLAEMHLARQGVLRALFGFNLGVELGQGALVLTVAPLLALLRRRAWFTRTAMPALSLVSLCVGAYWLVERAFLGG